VNGLKTEAATHRAASCFFASRKNNRWVATRIDIPREKVAMKSWVPAKTREQWVEEQVLEAFSDLGIGFEEKQQKQQTDNKTKKNPKKEAA
jgi:hypothetical protein